MPRQSSARLAGPVEPFTKSDAVAAVADQVIADNVGFRNLREIEVAYLLNNRPLDPADAAGIDAIVKAVKAPPVWSFLSDVHVAVWVIAGFWHAFSEDQRRAAITHALSHVMVEEDDAGEVRVKIAPHDVEEFHRVAAQFGSWTTSVELFAKAIAAQRKHAGELTTAVEEAVQQLDGVTITDPESGATATVTTRKRPRPAATPAEAEPLTSEAVAAGAITPEEADATEAAIAGELCGTPIADGVSCGLPAFHDGAHEGGADPEQVADGAAPKRPRRR